jgi:hypothetical protein
MTVWLVAEDRVQIVRADSVITFTAVPVKPTGIEHADPLARMPSYDRIRILAATASARNADTSPWTALITFKANGKGAVKVLTELAETIAVAEEQLAQSPPGRKKVLYVHGPLPRLDYDPLHTQVWYIAEELPVKDWPTSGSYFTDPLP